MLDLFIIFPNLNNQFFYEILKFCINYLSLIFLQCVLNFYFKNSLNENHYKNYFMNFIRF